MMMKPFLILAAALSLASTAAMAQQAASAPAQSTATAPAPAAAPAEEHLEELAEVQVHGKRLLQAIADAEDSFYQLYNKVNRDDRYDTACVNLAMNANSRITTRACIPGFVADAMADWQVFKMRCQPPFEGFDEFSCLDRNKDSRLSRDEAAARPELDVQFMALDTSLDNYLSREELQNGIPQGSTLYQPPSPELVLMEGSPKWAKAMQDVINSDPRLQDMAGHLDDLYRELMQVNQRFAKIKSDDLPEATTRRELGPRAR